MVDQSQRNSEIFKVESKFFVIIMLMKDTFRKIVQNQKKNKVNIAHEENDSVNSTKDIRDALILSMDSPIKSWILDSGISFHFSFN